MFAGYGNCSSVFDCGEYFAFGPPEVMVATNDASGVIRFDFADLFLNKS